MPGLQGRDVANNNNNSCPLQKVFNNQLSYDINQATKQESWDSSFHSVSLQGLLEHLSLDSKNIKKSLHHITNYIKNKKINHNKANDIPDLKSIDEVAWNFISTIYNLGWDALTANSDNKTFRQLVAFKFTPRIQETKKSSKGRKPTIKPASFIRLLSPVPTKT